MSLDAFREDPQSYFNGVIDAMIFMRLLLRKRFQNTLSNEIDITIDELERYLLMLLDIRGDRLLNVFENC